MRQLLIVLAFAGALMAQPRSFVGAGGCKSSNCHGNTGERPIGPDSRIKGNEFTLWSSYDKHYRAFKVLGEARGKRMAEILKISDATRDKRCTSCHVVGSPDDQRTDGVSCEACHGAASQWKDPHVRKDSHAESVQKYGMTDTRDAAIRSTLCLSCHLGNNDRIVDHELIAAGHPDLAFELDTFDTAMPAHHRPRDPKTRVQTWAIGQANALAEGMRLLTSHAGKNWPEFSDLECYQCHHDLRKDSWRINSGFPGRKAGTLRVNTARFEVLRYLVATAAPDQKAAFDSSLARLNDTVSQRPSDGSAVAQAARGLEKTADDLTKFFARADVVINPQAVVQALVTNIRTIAEGGVNSAEQATMSLDALGRPQEAVTPLYDYLEHPSTYNPANFIALFRKAAGV